MKRVTAVLGAAIACCLLLAVVVNAGFDTPMGGAEFRSPAIPDGSSSHAGFTRNMGQWPDNILCRAATAEATVWIASDGLYYQFTRRVEGPGTTPDPRSAQRAASVEQAVVKASFLGANQSPRAECESASGYVSNYFVGNDQSRWRTHVPSFQAITLRDIYPGVDLRFSADAQGRAVYEYVADAGADIGRIQIVYERVEEMSVADDQTAAVRTIWGHEVEIIAAPQDLADLSAPRLLVSSGTAPRAKSPGLAASAGVTVSYSTYLGGSGSDAGWDVAADADGNVYVTGETYSADFPLLDPLDPTAGIGNADAFLAKFSPEGTLIFSTYMVGEDLDKAFRLAVDAEGRPHMAGYTSSYDFPVEHAVQSLRGSIDGFAVKLSSTGDSLIFSTCLGGQRVDECWGIAVDAQGCTYLTGQTNSLDFPTQNPLMDRQGSLDQDEAFVAKLSADGGSLVYSTYLGGTLGDVGEGIAVDAQGCAYVTGGTLSPDFPLLSPYQATLGGYCDIFVTKLSPAGDAFIYSTYLGGSDTEWPVGIAVDASRNVSVAGTTQSPDYPTLYPYQTQAYPALRDVCITKLTSSGTSLIHSTYLGGTMDDWCYGFSMDTRGNSYVIGHTLSEDFPTTNAYQQYQGQSDCFVAAMPAAGHHLTFSTYLGGSDVDQGHSVTADLDGNVWVTGRTHSTDFPTVNPYQAENHLGYGDAFLTRFNALDASCCLCFSRGNIDDSPDCLITMGDLTVLIDNLFISLGPLGCPEAANVDLSADGLVTMADLTVLIDNLFITLTPLPACP